MCKKNDAARTIKERRAHSFSRRNGQGRGATAARILPNSLCAQRNVATAVHSTVPRWKRDAIYAARLDAQAIAVGMGLHSLCLSKKRTLAKNKI